MKENPLRGQKNIVYDILGFCGVRFSGEYAGLSKAAFEMEYFC